MHLLVPKNVKLISDRSNETLKVLFLLMLMLMLMLIFCLAIIQNNHNEYRLAAKNFRLPTCPI